MDSVQELGDRWRGIYTTLTEAPRRQLVGSLLEAPPDRSLSLPEAANMPEFRLDPTDLHLNLVHHHLPLMAEYGFIEWDTTPLSVQRGPAFEEVAAVLQAIDAYDEFPQHLFDGCHFHEQNGGDR
ncbi:MAG: hypothetical protein ABEJ68_06775 [Halobacteriaceae archaeon]